MISPLSTLLFGDWSDLCNLPANQSDHSMTEDKEHLYFEANAPGVRADEIEVMLEKGILTVKAATSGKKEETTSPFPARSRSYCYRVQLADCVDLQREPQATFSNGVIRIAFYKRQADLPKKISINS